MDIRKKELYEVFADSLEKSRTKEGGLLFDKLFEDMWEHIEPKLVQSLPIDSVVGSYNLKVGDKIKMPSGLRAEVIKTKVKVKDEFGGQYYLSDIEVG